jgi:hypothetical protein
MRNLHLDLAMTLLEGLTESEWEFLQEHRQSEQYRATFERWTARHGTWHVSHQRAATDGRNLIAVERRDGVRVTDRVYVEAQEVDGFVERVLEHAEIVRAAEQERARQDETVIIVHGTQVKG